MSLGLEEPGVFDCYPPNSARSSANGLVCTTSFPIYPITLYLKVKGYLVDWNKEIGRHPSSFDTFAPHLIEIKQSFYNCPASRVSNRLSNRSYQSDYRI